MTTWYECVEEDMKVFGLHDQWALFSDMWRSFISRTTSNLFAWSQMKWILTVK